MAERYLMMNCKRYEREADVDNLKALLQYLKIVQYLCQNNLTFGLRFEPWNCRKQSGSANHKTCTTYVLYEQSFREDK
jgi:hypothetical protein